MKEPKTPKVGTCAVCGSLFDIVSNRREYCGTICKAAATYADPPEIAEALEALSIAFVAAVRIDPGYVVEIAAEGSKLRTRQAA